MTRARLRSGVTGLFHPQMLLRIGFAEARPDAWRRHRADAVPTSAPAQSPLPADEDRRLVRGGPGRPSSDEPATHRPVSDGRGGTTWI